MSAPTDRMARLQARMAEVGADLVALAPGPHMDWLLGFHPHPDERACLLLVGRDRAGFLMPVLNAADIAARCDLPMHRWADAEGPEGALAQALADVGAGDARRLVLDETMRADHALLAMRALDRPDVAFTADTLGRLRMIKDATELAEMRMNAAIADRAMQAAQAAARAGMTELELGAVIRNAFAAQGAAPLFAIVGSGPNGAYPHHQTGDRRLQHGDAVVVDIGAGKGSFCSDITRMLAIGAPPEGYEAVHAAVEAGVQAAMAAARPGAKASDVDRAARRTITEAGYGEAFVHRTGHGIGLEAHEPPWITETSDTVLEAGMTFSIEPGIYLPGRFGIRLEEIVALGEDGPEVMSSLPRSLYVTEG